MRIVFFGTPDFAAQALQALIQGGHNVVSVVTQPDKRQGRSQRVSAPPVKVLAEQHAIPVVQPQSVRSAEFLKWMQDLECDVAVVAAYGKILPEDLLGIPTHGCVNIHASLLPRHRGASPIQQAILCGDNVSGVTIMQMDAGLDTGAMLVKRAVPIGPKTTAAELHDALAVLGGEAILAYFDHLKTGTLIATKQNDDEATYAPLLNKQDGRIDWSCEAIAVFDGVRGRFPWPGSYSFHAGKRVKFYPLETYSGEGKSGKPGEILSVDSGRIVVACGKGTVTLGMLQLEGKKALATPDFLRGYAVQPGEAFRDA